MSEHEGIAARVLLRSLLIKMISKGLISHEDMCDVYDHALTVLEQPTLDDNARMQARKLLERLYPLRPDRALD